MRLTLSPLISKLSGTAADAVAASWKGIQYVRQYVVPQNPNSAAQQLVRNTIARLNPLWQTLGTLASAAWTYKATGLPLSAWNLFTQKNFVAEKAGTALLVTPYRSDVQGLGACTGNPGANKIIAFSWFAGFADPTDNVEFLVRENGTNRFQLPTYAAVVVSALTANLTVEKAVTVYNVYAFVHKLADAEYSESVCDMTCTSG
jgi:hypothetical protein